MKALQLLQYGTIENSLSLNDIESPVMDMSDNDIIIHVKAAAINPIDKGIIDGNFKVNLSISLPATLAYDVSGVVVVTGSLDTKFNIGDEIYARAPQYQMGTLSEFACINSKSACLKPANLSFEEAASIPLAALTALQALKAAEIGKSQKLLVYAGACGLGNCAIQYAKAKGAYVYACTDQRNAEWLNKSGADKIITYQSDEYKRVVKQVDMIFDTLSHKKQAEFLKEIKSDGRVISIQGGTVNDIHSANKDCSLNIPKVISIVHRQEKPSYKYVQMNASGTDLQEIKMLVEKGIIKPTIDKLYPFRESTKAFMHLASGEATGKVVIKVH